MRLRRIFLIAVLLGFFMECMDPLPAHAFRFYWEAGTGKTSIQGAAGLFGDANADSLDRAMNLLGSVGFELRPNSAIHFQLGLQYRYYSGFNGTTRYVVQTLYPLIRVDANRVMLGIGISPLVYTSTTTGFDFFDVSHRASAIAIMAEAGYYHPIIPTFHIGAVVGLHSVMNNGFSLSIANNSPKMAIDGMIVFRFFYGESKGISGGTDDPYKGYEGWRYPLGEERNYKK